MMLLHPNLNITKHIFFTKFDNHEWKRIILREWKRIILSHIHEDIFMNENDMIHKLTGLSNEGSNLVNIKNVNKLVETNLKIISKGRNMKLDMIKECDVRLVSNIIGYNMNYSSRLNSIPV